MNAQPMQAVPNLTTAQEGPPHELERHLLDHQAQIECWLRRQWSLTPAPVYASVDLRNAGYKLAPVDTNMFPAGFNNLNPAFMPLCVQAAQAAVERIDPGIERILIVPESHTRNLFYLESLYTLQSIFERAGFTVRLGSLIADLTGPTPIALPSGRSITLEPLARAGRRVQVQGFDPNLVLLNNDLSGGRPALLEDLEQPIRPPLGMGWSNRLKSTHFTHYHAVAREFGAQIGLDPWLIDPLFRNCGEIDFMKGTGTDCLVRNVELLLFEIRAKYDQFGIKAQPFVFIKADAGTYGMGVMTVTSPLEVLELNRKQRTRMATTKEGQANTNVIIQEGVYTAETWGDTRATAEPVVYMIDHHVVGGFYRVNTDRSATDNLNAPGMRFERLAFADCGNAPEPGMAPEAEPNRFYAYGVIARLALLAAAREVHALR